MDVFPSFVECVDQNLYRLRVKNPICPERADEFEHSGAPAVGPKIHGIMTPMPTGPQGQKRAAEVVGNLLAGSTRPPAVARRSER